MPPFEANEGKAVVSRYFKYSLSRILAGGSWREKRLTRNAFCRTFSYCTALIRSKHNDPGQFATGCPPFDKEVYGPIWDEARQ